MLVFFWERKLKNRFILQRNTMQSPQVGGGQPLDNLYESGMHKEPPRAIEPRNNKLPSLVIQGFSKMESSTNKHFLRFQTEIHSCLPKYTKNLPPLECDCGVLRSGNTNKPHNITSPNVPQRIVPSLGHPRSKQV